LVSRDAQGRWHTWIDYERFHALVAAGRPPASKEYMAATPAWAVYGSSEAGFDPDQQRVRKERRHPGKEQEGCA
jgi:tRNA wybutosine-synthesizing protein 1